MSAIYLESKYYRKCIIEYLDFLTKLYNDSVLKIKYSQKEYMIVFKNGSVLEVLKTMGAIGRKHTSVVIDSSIDENTKIAVIYPTLIIRLIYVPILIEKIIKVFNKNFRNPIYPKLTRTMKSLYKQVDYVYLK